MPRAGAFGVIRSDHDAGLHLEVTPSLPPTPHPRSTPPLLSRSARLAAWPALTYTVARSQVGYQLTIDEELERQVQERWAQGFDHPGTAT